MKLTSSSVPKKGTKTASRVVDGEALVFHSVQGEVRIFNKVGTAIWELIDGKRSLDDIATALCEKYNVEESTAKEDVREFIENLQDIALISLNGA